MREARHCTLSAMAERRHLSPPIDEKRYMRDDIADVGRKARAWLMRRQLRLMRRHFFPAIISADALANAKRLEMLGFASAVLL